MVVCGCVWLCVRRSLHVGTYRVIMSKLETSSGNHWVADGTLSAFDACVGLCVWSCVNAIRSVLVRRSLFTSTPGAWLEEARSVHTHGKQTNKYAPNMHAPNMHVPNADTHSHTKTQKCI